MVSNEARIGIILQGSIFTTLTTHHAHRTGPFRPTIALQMARVGVPASPWMWAKARSKLGALIRPCGDGVVLNVEPLIYFTFSLTHRVILFIQLFYYLRVLTLTLNTRC